MVAALVTCAVVIAVLVAVLVHQRRQMDAVSHELDGERAGRTRAEADAEAEHARSEALTAERDAALERVTRSRRDAAEVANRLQAETQARSDAETERDALRAELDALVAARTRTSSGEDASGAEAHWALVLREMEQTWRVSIGLGPTDASPFADTDDPFRTAVEIVTDAAREEGGAAIELTWEGDAPTPPPERATLALAVVRDVVASLATTAGRTDLTVAVAADVVEIRVDALDDEDVPMVVDLPPSLQVEPGVARIC